MAAEVGDSEVWIGIGDSKEVMWDATTFFFSDFIGEDFESFVDLDFVGVYNLSWKTSG